VMPSASPASSVTVTSSHRHFTRHHLATVTTTTTTSTASSSSSSSSMSGAPLSHAGQHQQLLSRTNLYIRGLKPDTTDKDLVNLCQQLASTYNTCFVIILENQVLRKAQMSYDNKIHSSKCSRPVSAVDLLYRSQTGAMP